MVSRLHQVTELTNWRETMQITAITWTLAQAKAKLREFNLVLTKNEGEYRVNFKGGREASAYYTDDINDAVCTGFAMAE